MLVNPEDKTDDIYVIVDSYCDNKKCDCRRVLLNIYKFEEKQLDRKDILATISYGWEPISFYRRWAKGMSDQQIRDFKGPSLDNFQPQSALSDYFLEQFKILIDDGFYKKQLISRYTKAKYKQSRSLPKDLKPRLGLTKPCECRSGLLFRNCCAPQSQKHA